MSSTLRAAMYFFPDTCVHHSYRWCHSTLLESFGSIRSYIYDNLITKFTTVWYRQVLETVSDGSYLLDVGVGTGAALVANTDIIIRKRLRIVGVDYDANYVERCQQMIIENGLENQVEAICCSFYDYPDTIRGPEDTIVNSSTRNNIDTCKQEKKVVTFDNVYFSGSFMIFPDKAGALHKAASLLTSREQGRIYFTQTFELTKNWVLEYIKPKLSYWTTIDFGEVTYVDNFENELRKGGIETCNVVQIDDGKAVVGVRESRLVVAKCVET